jgi:protein-L-isoaspartate(D-aspartate) O-methyltransferase
MIAKMKIPNIYRNLYAQLVTNKGGIDQSHKELISAFGNVRREDFLGPAPWRIAFGGGSPYTETDETSDLYQDVLVALKSEVRVNNGQPSLHATCLDALNILAGDNVIHVGAGTGYYTAIMAELIGQTGKIYAYEVDEELAQQAEENLHAYSNVDVREISGTVGNLPSCNAIYVNAGITNPPSVWFEALSPGGRVLFPLTSTLGSGGMLFLVQVDELRYSAKFICAASFISCIGARDEVTAFKLTDSFTKGGARNVQSFHRGSSPDNSCWFAGNGWWLSTDPVT